MSSVRKPPISLTLLAAVVASMGLYGCGGSDDNIAAAPAPAPAPATQAPLSCVQLKGMAIPSALIGLPTTGATVTSTEVVAAAGTGTAAIGEYCKVLGDINPVDPTAPKIKFQLNLPTNWNNKAMMFGGGGYNGSISTGDGNVPAGPADQPTPLGRGYTTFGSDSGHQADSTNVRDGRFGQNDEALNNFSSDALKKTRDVAMFLINLRYATKPQRAYFAGGSTGGREALLAVSNWPQDWDGAIVLYPAWDAVSLDLYFGHITRELAKPGAYPNPQKRAILMDAALEACDGLDGVKDRLISNPSACNATFDPAIATLNGQALRCAGGADTGDTCLSDAQIKSFKVLNSPLQFSYVLASGENSYPGYNAWGSDFGRSMPADATPIQQVVQPILRGLALGTDQPAFPMPSITAPTSPPFGSTFWDQWVRFFVTRDANVNSLMIDPANPGTLQSRIVQLSGIQEAYKADLSAFQAKGGKILMAHGANDVLVSNRATQRYVQRLRTAMGNDKVNSFLRYYEIPGYGHAGSTVFNAAWDSVTALESWVERSTVPGNQIVADTLGVTGRTRPLCEYPAFPRYKGAGDVNVAASYSCSIQ